MSPGLHLCFDCDLSHDFPLVGSHWCSKSLALECSVFCIRGAQPAVLSYVSPLLDCGSSWRAKPSTTVWIWKTPQRLMC
jgi:hypothetical protein